MKKLVALILALAMCMSLAACGGTTNGDNQGGNSSSSSQQGGDTEGGGSEQSNANDNAGKKTKVAAVVTNLDSLDPYLIRGAITRDFLLYEPLWAFNEDNTEIEGVIAKDWTIDGTGVDVEIYDYVFDSAGNHITASDVVYSYQAYIDGGVQSNAKYLASMEATGDYTVHIEFTCEVYPLLLASICKVDIVSEAAYSAADADFVAHPVSTGPYVVTSFTAAQSATFEKRDDYWQTDESKINYAYKANVDVVELDCILESAQVQTGLETGNLQIGAVTATIKNDLDQNDKVSVTALNGKYNHQIMLNCYQGVLSESKELRQAILYCINSEELAMACTGGTGSVTYSMGMGENVAGFQTSWESEDYYNYDLEKAKDLVRQAGYDPADTGITLKWLGKTEEQVVLCSQAIQAYLSEIGIKLEINNLDNTTYMSQRNAYDESGWDLAFTDGVPKGNYIQGVITNVDARQYDKGNAYGVNDETEQNLLMTALYDQSAANIDALHQYVKDQAGIYGLFLDYDFWAHDANLEIVVGNDGELSAGASILSSNYSVFAD
jgi:ABC-type transport system substrate-binding protein